MKDLSGTTALVTGASRGLGRGIAAALSAAGAHVIAVARDGGPLADLRAQLTGSVTPVSADVADPVVAGQLIDAPGVAAYASRAGLDTATFVQQLGQVLTPEQAGRSVLELVTITSPDRPGPRSRISGRTWQRPTWSWPRMR